MVAWPTHKAKRAERAKLKYRHKRRNKLRRRFERGGKRVIRDAIG